MFGSIFVSNDIMVWMKKKLEDPFLVLFTIQKLELLLCIIRHVHIVLLLITSSWNRSPSIYTGSRFQKSRGRCYANPFPPSPFLCFLFFLKNLKWTEKQSHTEINGPKVKIIMISEQKFGKTAVTGPPVSCKSFKFVLGSISHS